MKTDQELTLWQKKQAAILYYFACTDYLEELKGLVDDLIRLADDTLAKAESERRDRFLIDDRWGARDTAANWANNGWQFLINFRLSLVEEIAARAVDSYQFTSTTQFIRGTNELSLGWTTPEEEDKFQVLMENISEHGARIDETLAKYFNESRWDDFGFAVTWEKYKERFVRLPRFRLRLDIEAETGTPPPRSGVYIPQDDIHGALQFASRRGLAAELLKCPTFNETGLHALKFMGRRALWIDTSRMYEFATLPEHGDRFKTHMVIAGKVYPSIAPGAVARHSFTSRPCKWYFIEMIDGEFEDYDDATIPGVIEERGRFLGGERCTRAGYYATLAKDKSRR